MSIRVAIVEDDRTVRQNLALFIDGAPGFSCVASCSSAEEAWQRLPAIVPEVVLMDLHLPGQSGIACLSRLKEVLTQTQVIMLTVEEDNELVFESLKAGATGYLVKHVGPEKILEAVAEVHNGGAPMSSHIAREVVSAFRRPPTIDGQSPGLSPREEEVLTLLSRGYRSKEIAEELGVAVATTNTYVRHIYEKFHVRSRAEAVAKFTRR